MAGKRGSRVEALMAFRERGIPTVVWMTPILPFINDTEENISNILNGCVHAGVKGVICWNTGLTLREGDREYYYAALDKYFPGLKDRYISTFGDAYDVPSPDSRKLMQLFKQICNAR